MGLSRDRAVDAPQGGSWQGDAMTVKGVADKIGNEARKKEDAIKRGLTDPQSMPCPLRPLDCHDVPDNPIATTFELVSQSLAVAR